MTKISNQYSLTNVLTADVVNGRVGINNGSPTVALDVTGAGKFSNVVTATRGSFAPSFIAIGSGAGNGQIQISNSANYVIGAGTDYGGMSFTVGGSERFNILNNGNVGIGTTSPTAKLHVDGAIFQSNAANGIYNNYYETYNGGSTPFTISASGASATVQLFTAGAERMRILANGNVLIGNTTDSGDRLRVTGSIASNGSSAGMFFQCRVAGNFLGFYSDNTSTMLVYNTNVGNIATINQSNGSYTALSDVNKKKDFEQSNIGLNEVLQLKPTLYRMKTDEDSSSKHLGFIAQEVKAFIPQAYTESGEGDKKFIGLTEMPLIAALTKAVQQQQTQINELKALINA